ncbi:MAG: NAD(P)H-quinone oxidoreductase [Myxococcaceae bacterium]
MRAYVTDFEGPQGLKLTERPSPKLGPGQLRIKLKATALNRADLLHTMGLYPPPPGVDASIPGMDYAGEVIEAGLGASRHKVGDRVMGIVASGAWGEELIAEDAEAMTVPRSLDYAAAAAIPEAFITAYDALFLQAGLKMGQWALVHAVGSGVGSAAVQLIRWAKAKSIGTARSAHKLDQCKPLGMDHGIHVNGSPAFADEVKKVTNGGVNVTLDLVGGDYFPQTLEATASRGTVMLVGLTAGPMAEVPLASILSRRIHLIGTTMRSRGPEEKAQVAQTFAERVLPGFESGALKAVIGATKTFEELPKALEAMQSNETFGKVVLTV